MPPTVYYAHMCKTLKLKQKIKTKKYHYYHLKQWKVQYEFQFKYYFCNTLFVCFWLFERQTYLEWNLTKLFTRCLVLKFKTQIKTVSRNSGIFSTYSLKSIFSGDQKICQLPQGKINTFFTEWWVIRIILRHYFVVTT